MRTTFAHKMYYSIRGAFAMGPACGLKLALALFAGRNVRLRPRGYPHPFLLRGRDSDTQIATAVFAKEEYATPGKDSVDLILDLGANIGYSAIYFAAHYPKAKVVAVEPAEANYLALCANTKPYANIVPLQLGVWWREARVKIDNPGADSWAFHFSECGEGGVESTTVGELVRIHRGTGRVMVKMDIEGAEREIFQHGVDWIADIDHLQIEIHHCFKEVFEALSSYPYSAYISGENVVMDFTAGRKEPGA